MHEESASNLPASLLARARQRGGDVALRHKRLGLWQERTWEQLLAEVQGLASGMREAGFVVGDSLVILSRPRPEALLASLAAQWLGGTAALLDPLAPAEEQLTLLRELEAGFVLAEGQEEVERVRQADSLPRLLFYADGRGLADAGVQSYARLAAQQPDSALSILAQGERPAFSFHRLDGEGQAQQQYLSHIELLGEAHGLIEQERLTAAEEALAARTFAASGQARYLLAPWLLAGFRLNFPESLATRDNDRRELGPTLVLGTHESYGRLYALAQQRLPLPGSLLRRWLDWALTAREGVLRYSFGHWLLLRPLRDVLGLSRTRVPLLVGEALPSEAQAFFAALGVAPRAWPETPRWQATRTLRPSIAAWPQGHEQPA
ncbi:long-chain fatty acid--CoA ligase [Pseudomonas sp. PA1(2017)]|uniref:AMP-binding protein n=1 Tax=Pseudomonas sp. PA1(2017) TaxID=1932113 RepID=UPI00095E2D3E|nr:AMP-binding protein [Pseudomonas sp. PA1(2017)]OLU17175.1 long-chain fatty acid--CoA ligase [Pseudomonas sp. PA1(2017)]